MLLEAQGREYLLPYFTNFSQENTAVQRYAMAVVPALEWLSRD